MTAPGAAVILAVAERTRAGAPGSVQAKTMTLPLRAMRGNPLARDALVAATVTAGPIVPSGPTLRKT